MELFSPEFFSALAAIIVIDLVLAGDNAIVIALAARGLPERLRKRAILWGTFGAIAVRTAMTLIVVWLLKIPGLLLVGGVLLVWIAYKLLVDSGGEEAHEGVAASSFWAAMKTIIVADALMGLDNVLAVAGAAHGSFLLVVIGLLISIPIVIWGSQLVLKLVERYPAIVYLGSGVLALTAVKMAAGEPLLQEHVAAHPGLVQLAYGLVIAGVLGAGFMANRRALRERIAGHLSGGVPELTVPESGPLRVLVPIDGTDNSLAALRHVIDHYHTRHDIEVHVLHVRRPFSELVAHLTPRGNRDSYHWEAAEKALAPARALLARERVPHTDHVELGDRAEVIARVARTLGASLIAMGTARRSSLTRLLEDSVTYRVLNLAQAPVEVIVGPAVSKLELAGVPAALVALIALAIVVTD
jgi:YjbE family integral membrane protein